MSVKDILGDRYDKIVDLAKRRGFFWPSYEIYGGVAGFYDLGPLGVMLKINVVNLWREYFVLKHQDLVAEIETPIIAPEVVLRASGHINHFTDPIIECLNCGRKYRADHLIEENIGLKVEGYGVEDLNKIVREKELKCPQCGGKLSDVRTFNLLFKTTIGPYSSDVGYLRPEAAQGMFSAFKRVFISMRERLPLGIAQIGRVARNEISPRQGMVRLREFTIMEVEFFHDPEGDDPPWDRFSGKLRLLPAELRQRGEEKPIEVDVVEAVREGLIKNKWLGYWMCVARDFIRELGVEYSDMHYEEKMPYERAHYSAQTFDQLVRVSRWGWVEVSGHAYRTDYDLRRHMEISGEDMKVFKPFKEPRVVEVEKVVVDKAVLGRALGSSLASFLEVLRNMDVEEVKKALATSEENIVISGFRVPRAAVKIVKEVEKLSGTKIIPHVAEPSFGAERLVLIVLDKAYSEEENRVVLKIPKKIAPVKAAVFPLLEREELVRVAKEIYSDLVSLRLTVLYDESGSIGRRYARADEIGIPYAVTVDFQTLSDDTVTIRDRDTKQQIRVSIKDLRKKLLELLDLELGAV
ncbi:MAG: glycine--tRNA ligase [Sulfolobales archaeon]|nr:glycine--tRNA ligase [Sulfolobales archaeon]MDW8082280.1 glycine--tRNA ligase [Sulfolobales archaeon]